MQHACRSSLINVEKDCIDILGFTGHKNLLGPTGTGGLFYKEGLEPVPLIWGGTGGMSEIACMPDEIPMKYEAGTFNSAAIHALGFWHRFC
jgi:selenocysteine lyase/cysteine desulfurase